MTSWPPPEGFWDKLELGPGADRAIFRKAVEDAVYIYRRDVAVLAKAPPWQRLIEAFDRLLAEIRAIEDTLPAQIIVAVGGAEKRIPSQLPYRLNDVRASRQHAAFQLQLENELTDKRREQLYANLIVACVGVGRLRPSKSISGPTTRALKLILDHALPHAGHQAGSKKAEGDHSLTSGAIKKIIKRHLDRKGGKVLLGGADSPG